MAVSARYEHYELLGELAMGGMATVYLGRRKTSAQSRLVAIKSMRQELAADEAFAAMFLDEATLTARIKHPNVVETLDLVSSEGKLLIVMEYVEGISLATLLESAWKQRAPIPPAVAVAVLGDVLRGLHAAHELVDERGRPLSVVHRDVSPQNVIIGVDGVARILDFGVAKAAVQRHVTEQGEIKGKLAYMPPEQQFGELVDRRSDVYAAGVVLWEMLVGRRLFTAPDEDELVRLVFEMEVPGPSVVAGHPVPRSLDPVVLRALAKRREDRWWSAEQMASALGEALRPAAAAEVASVLATIAGREIEQRRRHVRELQGKQSLPLEREAQTVLEVLTARGAEKLPSPGAFSPPTKVETPLARESARRHSSPDAKASRRAERRARRRRQVVFTLAGVLVLVLVLMAIALFLGLRAREAELEDSSSGTGFPPPPPLPTVSEAPSLSPGLTLDGAAIPSPGPASPSSPLPRTRSGSKR